MPMFEVHYRVTRPVDFHPTGGRIRSADASNWIGACDVVRKFYGDAKQDCIQIDAVTTRDAEFRRVYHYSRFGES